MAQNVFFKKGLLANLPESYSAGTFYVTTDERAMYLDIDDSTRIRLGDFIQVAAVENLPTEGASTSALYYCVKENILAKWNGSEWTQINKQPTAEEMKVLLGLGTLAYKSTVVEGDLSTELVKKINDASAANHGHDNKDVIDGITAEKVADWDDAVSKEHTHNFADEAALNGITAAKVADWDDAVSKEHTHTFVDTDVEDAISKKHSHTFVESELNKIVAGDVAKWNGVVADHLVAADKTELVDSIGDVNTALENYKTSNNEALAGVKATADAAATKEYTDAELTKKVAKADYEVDKATFATKTEIAKLAGVSEGANKVEASTNNGSIKIDGVETVVYTHPEKHAIADVTGLQDALDGKQAAGNYSVEGHKHVKADITDFAHTHVSSEITDLDATIKGYDYATKTELGNVDKKFENYKSAADQKTIDDEQDRRLGVLEGASATHATKDELNGVDAKFADYTKTADLPTDLGDFTNNAGYAKTADVNTELAKKADKSVVDAMYTNAQIDGFIAEAKKYADDNDADTKYGIVYDSDNKKIKLVEGGTDVEIDASAFIKDGMISNVTIGDDNDLVITFNTDAGKENIVLPLDQLVDIYTGVEGDRIKVTVNADKSISADLVAGSIGKDYLDAGVKASLALADSAIQAHQDISHLATIEALNGVDAKFANYTNTTDMNAKFDLKADKTQVETDIATAKSGAEAKAAELDAALKTELQAEIDADVKALADNVYTKAQTYTKTEVDAMLTWGEF